MFDHFSSLSTDLRVIDIELACSVSTGKILVENKTNIFPVLVDQASSIKFLLSWLYFEFPDGTAHLIGDKARATIRRENLFLFRHFRKTSAKMFGQTTKKGFYLTSK